MPKYGRYQVETEANEKKDTLHPIWRGIGCILLIVIPIISGFFSNYLVNQRNTFSWMIIPNELIINRFEDPMIAVKAVYFIIIALLLFLIMGIITFLWTKSLVDQNHICIKENSIIGEYYYAGNRLFN
jgi:hypothetical protein